MHKDILSENDRKVLCDFLMNTSTDEILLRAAEDTKQHYLDVQNDFQSVRKFIGDSRFFMGLSKPIKEQPVEEKATTPSTKPSKAPAKPVGESEGRPNTEPPGTPAKRIGSSTLEQITRMLGNSKGETASDVNIFLNGVLANTQGVLKLLWARKVVGFDGLKFYLL